MATKELNVIVLVSHEFVHRSFLNGAKASREFSSLANKCATVLIHERSAGASDQTFPQKRAGPRRRASVACCRSRPTVSPHKERRGAASQQHYRFLSVFVCLAFRETTRHEGDGEAAWGRQPRDFSGGVGWKKCQLFHCRLHHG